MKGNSASASWVASGGLSVSPAVQRVAPLHLAHDGLRYCQPTKNGLLPKGYHFVAKFNYPQSVDQSLERRRLIKLYKYTAVLSLN